LGLGEEHAAGYAARPGRKASACEHRLEVAQGIQHTGYEIVLHFDVTFAGYNDNLSIHIEAPTSGRSSTGALRSCPDHD
jgi:hypothetical protein